MFHDAEIAIFGMDHGDPRPTGQDLHRESGFSEISAVKPCCRYHDQLTAANDHISSLPVYLSVCQQDVGIHVSVSEFVCLWCVKHEKCRRAEIEDGGLVNIISKLLGQIQKMERGDRCCCFRSHRRLLDSIEGLSLGGGVLHPDLERLQNGVYSAGVARRGQLMDETQTLVEGDGMSQRAASLEAESWSSEWSSTT